MDSLELVHLIAVCVWGGILLVEFIMETIGFGENGSSLVARLHFWTDVLVEVPIVGAVLVTGTILTARNWPPSALLQAKIAAALVAIGLNLYCTSFVILRYRRIGDTAMMLKYRKHITYSVLGVPFGAIAAYLGLRYFS